MGWLDSTRRERSIAVLRTEIGYLEVKLSSRRPFGLLRLWGNRNYFLTKNLTLSAATEVKFWSPVFYPPRAKIFGVWRSQWRVFRLLKPNIVSGQGGKAKKPSLELPAELSVVGLCKSPARAQPPPTPKPPGLGGGRGPINRSKRVA